MAPKKGHPEHENLERWVVSYADFMTLLFATFTALFAITQAKLDKVKEEEVLEQIRTGFQSQSLMAGIKSILQGNSPPAETTNPASPEKGADGDGVMGDFKQLTPSRGVEGGNEELEGEEGLKQLVAYFQQALDDIEHNMRAQMEAELNAQQAANAKAAGSGAGQGQGKGAGKGGAGGGKGNGQGEGTGGNSLAVDAKAAKKTSLEVMNDPQGARIRLNSQLLFASGTAVLRPEAKKALHTLAESLKDKSKNYLIQVEGHTDSEKIHSVQFPSNWELSTARASAVVRYLVQQEKFDRDHMSAAGYAATRPVDTNKTAKGRANNRRIEFLLYTDPKDKPTKPTTPTPPRQAAAKTPNQIVITPVSSHSSEMPGDVTHNQGPSGQFSPDSHHKSHGLPVVKSATTIKPKSGPVKVILQRTDASTGEETQQVVPVTPVAKSGHDFIKPIVTKHSGHH